MEFNARELNSEHLLERAKREASEIFYNPEARRGRTFEQVYANVLYGQAPEVYLIQKHGFTDNLTRYQDILEPNGERVEVKTTRTINGVSKTLMRTQDWKKTQPYRNLADILYIFIGDDVTGDYRLHGIFDWNKNDQKFYLRNT